MFDKEKLYIKQLALKEKSIKSISFSTNEKELIVYFTWKQDNYNSFYEERNIFRENVKNYLINQKYLFFKRLKSNSNKYTFGKLPSTI